MDKSDYKWREECKVYNKEDANIYQVLLQSP